MTRNDLLADLKVLAIWKREWETRAESAQFQFETIGLDPEQHDALIREGQELNELYRSYAQDIPGCLGEPESSREAEPEAPAIRGVKLKPNEQTSLSILHAANGSLSTEEWNDQARAAGLGIKRRAELYDIRDSLRRKGLAYEGPNGWSVMSK